MHDIDRTQMEYSGEAELFEHNAFGNGETEWGEAEWGGEAEWAGEGEWGGEAEGVFGETGEMQLAAELLEIGSEAELDRFLGSLIKKAGQAVGGFIKSPVGQALGGVLKGAAKQALPMIGSALGGYVGGSSGAKIGGQLASKAGQMFGLELEGLSMEDQEYEVAKSFVRFAGEAAKNAATAGASGDPRAIAKAAAIAAARQLAPGLLSGAVGNGANGAGRNLMRTGPGIGAGSALLGGAKTGRWYRRGGKIVLLGV